MTDGVYEIDPAADHTERKCQVFISKELAAIADRWRASRPDVKSRTAAIDQLVRLGAAESALRSMRQRPKK
jgi:hypothetical protein